MHFVTASQTSFVTPLFKIFSGSYSYAEFLRIRTQHLKWSSLTTSPSQLVGPSENRGLRGLPDERAQLSLQTPGHPLTYCGV